MAGKIENIVDTDFKTIGAYRELHKTSEHNAYLERHKKPEKKQVVEELPEEMFEIKIQNERNIKRKIEKQQEMRLEKHKEEQKAFDKKQEKLLSPPSPLALLYEERQCMIQSVCICQCIHEPLNTFFPQSKLVVNLHSKIRVRQADCIEIKNY